MHHCLLPQADGGRWLEAFEAAYDLYACFFQCAWLLSNALLPSSLAIFALSRKPWGLSAWEISIVASSAASVRWLIAISWKYFQLLKFCKRFIGSVFAKMSFEEWAIGAGLLGTGLLGGYGYIINNGQVPLLLILWTNGSHSLPLKDLYLLWANVVLHIIELFVFDI